jgi:hypothetical protein
MKPWPQAFYTPLVAEFFAPLFDQEEGSGEGSIRMADAMKSFVAVQNIVNLRTQLQKETR